MGSFDFFEETAPRKTTENTAKHRDGGVGSVVDNHRGGGENSMVVTTLMDFIHGITVVDLAVTAL